MAKDQARRMQISLTVVSMMISTHLLAQLFVSPGRNAEAQEEGFKRIGRANADIMAR